MHEPATFAVFGLSWKIQPGGEMFIFPVFLISLNSLMAEPGIKPNSPYAIGTGQSSNTENVQNYFYEGFETYSSRISPWNGYQPWKWLVFDSDLARSGEKALFGSSRPTDDITYVISPTFSTNPDDPAVIAESYLDITTDGSTWQFVPQGEEFILARLIILPDGQAAVFDATTGDNFKRLPFFFELEPQADYVKCAFVVERFSNRYSLFLNDQRVHTGTPFTTELTNLVFVCDLESFVSMSIDDVSVRPYATNVPTLSTWGLMLLISTLVGLAVWQQRCQRHPHAAN